LNILNPLKIGSIEFNSNLIQGPLAGYSCAPMRVQTWKFSQPAYCSTEMLSAAHLVNAKSNHPRFIYRDEKEGALSVQLSGNNPEVLGKATKIITKLNNPEMIDLNCGCPVTKIRAKKAGSKLLVQQELLASIIKEMKNNTDAAITVKVRVAGNSNEHDNVEVAQLIESAGADAIVVHGRHWTERYDTPCRYDQITQIVKAVDIPVIGNGDIEDLKTLKKMLKTGCKGAMISRASLGQPWIFAQLESEASGEAFASPPLALVSQIFIDHIRLLATLEGEHRAVLQARSLAKYYFRAAENSGILQSITQSSTLMDLLEIIGKYC